METETAAPTAPAMHLYSRALDEIYALRRAFAYEADIIEASLTLKSFPKTRRETAVNQVEHLRALARGHRDALWSYTRRYPGTVRAAFRWAEAELTTVSSWESERDELPREGFYSEPAPTAEYKRAVDEIIKLRSAAACEAMSLDVVLYYRSFPKSRRTITEQQVSRLSKTAGGQVELQYAGESHAALRGALISAGAKLTLSRASYEAEVAIS